MNTPGGGRRRVERQTGELIGRKEEEEGGQIQQIAAGPWLAFRGVSRGSLVTEAYLSCERFGDRIPDVTG